MAKLAWRTALSLSPLWSLRLPMALAFQLRQPSRAEPLPGLCHNLAGTNSCGKCAMCASAINVLCGMVRREERAGDMAPPWL